MTARSTLEVPLSHPDRLYIGGTWVKSSTDERFDVDDSRTEDVFLTVPAANAADLDRGVHAAREAFDAGAWPQMTHAERAGYLIAFADRLRKRGDDAGKLWPREAGVLHQIAVDTAPMMANAFEFYAGLATDFPFEERVRPTAGGEFGLLVREPVGVVGAIVPWNSPLLLSTYKVAPALLAGCTVILKSSPEAPGIPYLFAEIADEIGLPPGVLNVLTADREVSELLVRDPRVDKITFTGSTAAGRRIAALCGERIARVTLELGGKSAAVILDDGDLKHAAETVATAECRLAGQVCGSLTRIIVGKDRHDEFVEALASSFSSVHVGDPYDATTQMGPLASERQRDRVLHYIERGVAEGAQLVAGGGRPSELDRGWYVEPTIFAHVDNSTTIAREEIFGPVLSVIPADGEEDAVRIANDSNYGLNASIFTGDVDRARSVASRLRSGTVGHNALRGDFGIAFGGFKQSGIGREGGREGLLPFLEAKTVILDGVPTDHHPIDTF